MKKVVTLTLAAILAAALSLVSAGTPIGQAELPKAAQTFLSEHFPGDKVIKAEKDGGFRGAEYEVDLMSGAEVEFKDNGEWKEVKVARGAAVPAAIVPAAIAKYVANSFAGLPIVEISRKRGGYEVELSNGTELKLTEDAKPMRLCQN